MILLLFVALVVSTIWLLYRGRVLFQIPVEKLVRILNIDVPSIPQVLVDNVTETSVGLHWENCATATNKCHFVVYINGVQATVVDENCCVLEGLLANTFYEIDVVSINDSNFRSKSISKYVKTLPTSSYEDGDMTILSLISQNDELNNSKMAQRIARTRANTMENGHLNNGMMIRSSSSSPPSRMTSGITMELSDSQIKQIENLDNLKVLVESYQEELEFTNIQITTNLIESDELKISLESELESLRDQKRTENDDRSATKSEINLLDGHKTKLITQIQKLETKRSAMRSHIDKMKSQLLEWQSEIASLSVERQEAVDNEEELKLELYNQIEELQIEIGDMQRHNIELDEDIKKLISTKKRAEATKEHLAPFFEKLREQTEESGAVKSKGLVALNSIKAINLQWYEDIIYEIDLDAKLEAEWRARQQIEVANCVEIYNNNERAKQMADPSYVPQLTYAPIGIQQQQQQQLSPAASVNQSVKHSQSQSQLQASTQHQQFEQQQKHFEQQQYEQQYNYSQYGHTGTQYIPINNANGGGGGGGGYFGSPQNGAGYIDSPLNHQTSVGHLSLWNGLRMSSGPSSPSADNYNNLDVDEEEDDFAPILPTDLTEELNGGDDMSDHEFINDVRSIDGVNSGIAASNKPRTNPLTSYLQALSGNTAPSGFVVGGNNNNMGHSSSELNLFTTSGRNVIAEFFNEGTHSNLHPSMSNEGLGNNNFLSQSPSQSFISMVNNHHYLQSQQSPRGILGELESPHNVESPYSNSNSNSTHNFFAEHTETKNESLSFSSALSPKKISSVLFGGNRKRSDSNKQSKFFNGVPSSTLAVDRINDLPNRRRGESFGSILSNDPAFNIWGDNGNFLNNIHKRNVSGVSAYSENNSITFINDETAGWANTANTQDGGLSELPQAHQVPSVVISETSMESNSGNSKESTSVDSKQSFFGLRRKSIFGGNDKEKSPISPQKIKGGFENIVTDSTINEDEVVQDFQHVASSKAAKLFNIKGLTRRTSSQGSAHSGGNPVSEKAGTSPSKRRFSFFKKNDKGEEEEEK